MYHLQTWSSCPFPDPGWPGCSFLKDGREWWRLYLLWRMAVLFPQRNYCPCCCPLNCRRTPSRKSFLFLMIKNLWFKDLYNDHPAVTSAESWSEPIKTEDSTSSMKDLGRARKPSKDPEKCWISRNPDQFFCPYCQNRYMLQCVCLTSRENRNVYFSPSMYPQHKTIDLNASS